MVPPLPDGVVYTETVVHFASEGRAGIYQIAIVDIPGFGRRTVRIAGDRPKDMARIGERVTFLEYRGAVTYYTRAI